ncbi:MAG: hypothetical protein EOP84_07385 [Verrucomicrobiaceae bacterium]|nr:MAG: hypothetical protein EOP84_07385 [Verrucomicrobiaceae bacterium]
MKKTAILLAAVLSIGTAVAADVEVSTSTTTSGGTITEFTPGSAISVRTESSTSPVRYVVGDSVTYVDEAGAPVSAEIIKSGVPVTVHYIKEGDRMVARRVVVKKTTTTTTTPTAPVIEERRTKTTTTTTTKED